MKAFCYYLAIGAIGLLATFAYPIQTQAQTVQWDVCIDLPDFFLDDVNGDGGVISAGDGFTAVGQIFPGGSIPEGGVALCSEVTEARIGTFFARGRIVAGLPNAAADDFGYVDWQFRVDGSGEMETTGIAKAAPMYPHTIIGTTNEMYPDDGEMLVEVLDAGGFQIRVSFDLEEEDDNGGGDGSGSGDGGGGDGGDGGGSTGPDCNGDGVTNGLDLIGVGCA